MTSRHAWLITGLLGMMLVALSSGLKPWRAALAGAFWPADFAADVAAAHLFVHRVSPYGPTIRTVHMDLTGLPFAATLPYFPHPPFALIVSMPTGFLSFHAAAMLWFGVTMALIFALAVVLHGSRLDGARMRIGIVPLWLLLLAWPPVLYNLEKGQWSVLVAVLLAFSWQAAKKDQLRNAAVWAAVAASVKVFPVVAGGYFLIRSLRAARWFVGTGILLSALPMAWIGFQIVPGFIHESRLNLPYWESFPLVMFSIHGALSRALIGGQWAQPFVFAPVLARVVEVSVVGVLLILAIWTTVRAGRRRADPSLAFLVWMVLLPLVNPLGLGHTGVLLALPIVVLADELSSVGRDWHRWAWALALTLVSVPNQTVWRLTGVPAGPVEGLAIAALPAWGTLLLFTVALSIAHDRTRRASIYSSSGKIPASPSAPITAHESIGRHELTCSKG